MSAPAKSLPFSIIENYFKAIKNGQTDIVRGMLTEHPDLAKIKYRHNDFKYEGEIELDAYKFLGAYIGSVTGLHAAIIWGQDDLAKEIIDKSFTDDLDITFGGNNTALHLATLYGAGEVVKILLARGANSNIRNSKEFTPIDINDDFKIMKYFSSDADLTKNSHIDLFTVTHQ
ncbi:hypothetical protein ROZALSC1DRAFT_27495 [Rozella allomycis CSF55]|uniref:Uncharacterized protein n=1 Tax=Rozella allomycis (strain CSF55) TaxID=988480 RepID=A0A075AUW8_ROZAC|nr:hypothetical protein O9G_002180 [Rozella allomycis CSF55]RKP21054.1 hypothetical protein ROZALSC1DRAFT_27495 [Rozella allomycis CSF55]|eukprot:EPZ32339.1 hypothetical protein O9G_002180 [Rozella allomycis CSF55]